jgi:HK97 family phage portal protein
MTRKNRNKAARNTPASGASEKRYITTDILGGGSSYDYMSTNSDIRPNKYGAAYIVLKNGPAQRCVDVRSSEVASANWSIIDRRSKESIATNEDPKDNPIARSILRYQEKYSEPFFGRWEQSLCVTGENYVQLVRNTSGYPADIEWLNPLMVDIEAPLNIIRGYRYNGGDGVENLQPHQVAYDRIPSSLFTDIYGWSPLMSVVMDAGIIINSNRVMSALFRNGATPGGVIRPKEVQGNQRSWSEDEARRIKQAMQDSHKGPDQAGRLAVFPFPMEVELFNQPDFQKWADLIKTLETQIYSAFGVPRSVAGDSDSTRYQASPDDRPNFKRLIKSELSRIQDSFNTTIVPFFDGSRRYQLEFDLSDYEVVPAETVTTANSMLLSAGITLNAYKRMVGEKEIGPAGDIYYMPSGIQIVREADLKAGNLPAPPIAVEQPQTPMLPSGTAEPAVDPTKDAGLPLFVGLSLANNDNLISLQRRLKELYPDADVKWNTPDDFHVTLFYAEMADDFSARDFAEALEELPIPTFDLRIGQLNSFDKLGEHALHLRVRHDAALKSYQTAVYQLAQEFDITCSPYSNPAQWIPHITMGYLPSRAGRTTFDSKLTVEPVGVVCDYGDETLWESVRPRQQPLPTPVIPTTSQGIDEFKAWVKFQRNNASKAKTRAFKFEAIPEQIAYRIREEHAAGKSADEVHEYLLPLLTGVLPQSVAMSIDQSQYDELPGNSKAYALHLQEMGTTADLIPTAVGKHYLRTLAAKAIQSTRIDFEDGVEDLLTDALAGRVERRRFGIILRSLIETAVRKAYFDGLSDGGITDAELDEDDIEWLDNWFDQQRAFVINLADAIYKDERVTEDEVTGKPIMWWNQSVAPSYAQALTSAAKNAAFERFLGSAEDHCDDCPAINGQVRRASFWRKIGIWNASKKTQCGGFFCDCTNGPSDKPITRGRFPKLIGFHKSADLHDHQHNNDEAA